MSEALPTRSPTVAFKSMDEGGILFCSRTEVYFGLDPVGAEIWHRLPSSDEDADCGFGQLLTELGGVYPDVDVPTLESDVREFIHALRESELVTDAGSATT